MASLAFFHQLLAENKNHRRGPPAFPACPLLGQVKLFTFVTEATLPRRVPPATLPTAGEAGQDKGSYVRQATGASHPETQV